MNLRFPPAANHHYVGWIGARNNRFEFRCGDPIEYFSIFRLANAVLFRDDVHHYHLIGKN